MADLPEMPAMPEHVGCCLETATGVVHDHRGPTYAPQSQECARRLRQISHTLYTADQLRCYAQAYAAAAVAAERASQEHPHSVVCSADRRKPLGCEMCMCMVVPRELFRQLEADVERRRELLDVPSDSPPWRVAEVWSSTTPHAPIPWLATHEKDQERVERHSSFIRWLTPAFGGKSE